jgi:hypothetical protein
MNHGKTTHMPPMMPICHIVPKVITLVTRNPTATLLSVIADGYLPALDLYALYGREVKKVHHDTT